MRKSSLRLKKKQMKGGNANFEFNPALYGSSDTGIKGVGCNGTGCNIFAANSTYKQSGGNIAGVSSYSTIGDSPIDLIGPNIGHAGHFTHKPTDIVRDTNNFASKIKGGSRKYQIGCKRMKKRSMKKRSMKKRSMKKRSTKRRSTKRRSTKRRSTKRRSTKRRSTKRRSMKKRGGEGPQPYSNTPISHGQEFNKTLDYHSSALASPTPLTAYNNCPAK